MTFASAQCRFTSRLLGQHLQVSPLLLDWEPQMPAKANVEEIWHAVLTGRLLANAIKYRRRFLMLFPANRRCKNCNAPFDHAAAMFMPLMGHGQYRKNPRFCNF